MSGGDRPGPGQLWGDAAGLPAPSLPPLQSTSTTSSSPSFELAGAYVRLPLFYMYVREPLESMERSRETNTEPCLA
jgi:hypothetical protein